MREVFICDEDARTSAQLRAFFTERYADRFRVSRFTGCMDLVGAIQLKERVPDLLITETLFHDGDGIDTVSEIQDEHPWVRVIYISRDARRAAEIFRTDPSYFLLKPIDQFKLAEAVSKVVGELDSIREDGLLIRNRGIETVIPRSDIVFIESKARKLCIHMSKGADVDVYEKMDDISQRLGKGFVRCHKSFLANLRYTAARETDQLVLLDGTRLPISKNRARQTKEALNDYWTR